MTAIRSALSMSALCHKRTFYVLCADETVRRGGMARTSRRTELRRRFRFVVPSCSASAPAGGVCRTRKSDAISGETDVNRTEKSVLLPGTVPMAKAEKPRPRRA